MIVSCSPKKFALVFICSQAVLDDFFGNNYPVIKFTLSELQTFIITFCNVYFNSPVLCIVNFILVNLFAPLQEYQHRIHHLPSWLVT